MPNDDNKFSIVLLLHATTCGLLIVLMYILTDIAKMLRQLAEIVALGSR